MKVELILQPRTPLQLYVVIAQVREIPRPFMGAAILLPKVNELSRCFPKYLAGMSRNILIQQKMRNQSIDLTLSDLFSGAPNFEIGAISFHS